MIIAPVPLDVDDLLLMTCGKQPYLLVFQSKQEAEDYKELLEDLLDAERS